MDVSISFTRPQEVFVRESILEEQDLKSGEPALFNFDVNNEERILASTVRGFEELDRSEEEFALFNILPQLSEIPERIENSLREDLITDSKLDIDGADDLSHFIHDLDYRSILRYGQADVIIGADVFTIFSPMKREGLVYTPFGQIPEKVVKECLSESDIGLESVDEDPSIITTDSALFCSTGHKLPDDMKKAVRDRVSRIEYFVYGANYMMGTDGETIHGPILKDEDPPDKENLVVKVEESDVEFTSATRVAIVPTEQSSIPELEELQHTLTEEFGKYDIDLYSDEEWISLVCDSYDLSITVDNSIYVMLYHASEKEENEVIEKLDSWAEELSEEYECGFDVRNPHQHGLHEPLLNDVWAFDTNTIYRQSPNTDSTDISKFIFSEPKAYNKSVKIPWQVTVEINRHKEESNSLRRVSKDGIENLKSLGHLDNFGYIDLKMEELPSEFDNSVHPNTGTSDLGILSSVPEDGVLLSNDERLRNLCHLFEVPVRDIIGSPEDDIEVEVWEEVKSKLSEEPMTKKELFELIENSLPTGGPSEYQDHSDSGEKYFQTWLDSEKIIQYPNEGEQCVSLCNRIELTPTYRMISRIAEGTVDAEEGKMMSRDFLEQLRRCLGGLSTTEFPKIQFIIPERYVYRAEEVNQVNDLMLVYYLENAEYKSVTVDVDRSSVQTELNEAAVKTAQQSGSLLLCDKSESDLSKLSQLINVSTVDMS